MKKIKSKKFVVYFFQAGDGGTIVKTDQRGVMTNKEDAYRFGNKKEAMSIFEDLVDSYLRVKKGKG